MMLLVNAFTAETQELCSVMEQKCTFATKKFIQFMVIKGIKKFKIGTIDLKCYPENCNLFVGKFFVVDFSRPHPKVSRVKQKQTKKFENF
jgi:hypothetical protein